MTTGTAVLSFRAPEERLLIQQDQQVVTAQRLETGVIPRHKHLEAAGQELEPATYNCRGKIEFAVMAGEGGTL
jgi:hypothetical protein